MAQLESWRKRIDSSGAALVFIAAQKKEGMFHPQKFLSDHPISFPFLLDQDRQVTKSYGVYHALGLDAIRIARPASFVIDRDRIIRYLYVGSNQLDRAPVEEIIDALQRAARK